MNDAAEREAFAALVRASPAVEGTLDRVGRMLPDAADREPRTFVLEQAGGLLLVSLGYFVAKEMLLPWLHELDRYNEMWRQKFGRWVDEQYRRHGLDPVEAKMAGDALKRELEADHGADFREAWTALAKQVAEGKS